VCGKGELVERKTRRGKTFFSCNQYPDCKAATWDLAKPAEVKEFTKKEWKKKPTGKTKKRKA
jgi:DNA topoisomerase-1